jgi:hypothetical protein
VVLVVRNARHSTEAKGTRLTPKEPDRPAAIMPLNACRSSAAAGAPRAVKRSRPVGYVALPDAQRAVCDRQQALLRNDHLSRAHEPVPHGARCPQPRRPRRSTDLTAADNGLARFPRSHRDHAAPPSIFRDRCGIRLCRRRSSIEDPACHQPGVSWPGTCPFGGGDRSPRRSAGVTRRRVVPLAQARSECPRLIGRRRHDRYDGWASLTEDLTRAEAASRPPGWSWTTGSGRQSIRAVPRCVSP